MLISLSSVPSQDAVFYENCEERTIRFGTAAFADLMNVGGILRYYDENGRVAASIGLDVSNFNNQIDYTVTWVSLCWNLQGTKRGEMGPLLPKFIFGKRKGFCTIVALRRR